jgi:hypothetical protein
MLRTAQMLLSAAMLVHHIGPGFFFFFASCSQSAIFYRHLF